jgi:uncharacterized protein (TIGR02246 family)
LNRTLIFFASLLIPICAASCQQPKASDEAAVRAVIGRETEGWAKFDAKEVASTYTEDAIWQNPFGVRLHGSAQLEKFLNNLFARPGYRAAKDTAPAKILDVRITSPTSATVWSDESSQGQIDDASGKPMQPRHSFYLEVLVKRNGQWKICDSIIMDELHLP